jgi:hypothetical protein
VLDVYYQPPDIWAAFFVWGEVRLTAGVQFEFKLGNLTRRHPERSRSSGAANDLACSAAATVRLTLLFLRL